MPETWTHDYGDVPWWYRGPAFRGLSVHWPSRRRVRGILAALLGITAAAAGCMQDVPIDQSALVAPPEGAETAIQTVMDDWSMTKRPEFYWYGGAALNCGGGAGWKRPGDDFCWEGDSWEFDGRYKIVIAVRPGFPLHDLSVAHEMCHMWLLQRGEDSDLAHTSHCFRYPDDRPKLIPEHWEGGDVDEENYRLGTLGM